ncbi:hypothetical protein BHE74_00044345 [Ensete ventricosum]|nr:hypothetical protein BHE74_00044345 [Ensete ventricosum]
MARVGHGWWEPRVGHHPQKWFGVGPDVVTSSAWGGWPGSVRCSAFELPDEHSCDMGPPSSAKMLVENLHACPIGMAYAFVSAEWAQLDLARAGTFIVSATGRSYLRSLLPLSLTMPSYLSTMPVVLAIRMEKMKEIKRPLL